VVQNAATTPDVHRLRQIDHGWYCAIWRQFKFYLFLATETKIVLIMGQAFAVFFVELYLISFLQISFPGFPFKWLPCVFTYLIDNILKIRDIKQSSNFRTSVLKFEFDLHTFGIRIKICPLFSRSNDRQRLICLCPEHCSKSYWVNSIQTNGTVLFMFVTSC